MATYTTETLKRYDWDAMSDALFEQLNRSPEGVDIYEICENLGGVSAPVGKKVIRQTRVRLAEEKANIITRVDGLGRKYALVTAKDGAAVAEWLEFHRKSAQAHLDTVRSVYLSVVESASTRAAREQAARVIANLDAVIADLSAQQL